MGAFATMDDLEARWRPLTSNEQAIAGALLDDASALLRARFPGIDSQVASGALDPQIPIMVVAGMVKRALIAPADGIAQQAETVGPYSQSQTFANPMRNVFLTAADLTLILGYQPSAKSHRFANDTNRSEGCTGYVYESR